MVRGVPADRAGTVVEELKPERHELMLGDPNRVARARCTLGSMSHFMKHLKQPVARRANVEDDRTGHFFEQRFYSGALLTEEALIAAMAYVDLNPVRAELAERIEEIRDTSISERLQVNSAEALADYLRPVVSGLDGWSAAAESPPRAVVAVEARVGGETLTFDLSDVASGSPPEGDREDAAQDDSGPVETEAPEAASPEESSGPVPGPEEAGPARPRRRPRPHFTLADYIDLVGAMAEADAGRSADRPDGLSRWLARTTVLRKRQCASATGRRCGDGLPTGPCSSGRRPCPPEAGARPAPWSPRGEPLGHPARTQKKYARGRRRRPVRAVPAPAGAMPPALAASLASRALFRTPVSAQARVIGGSRPAAAGDRQRTCCCLLPGARAPCPARVGRKSRVSGNPDARAMTCDSTGQPG